MTIPCLLLRIASRTSPEEVITKQKGDSLSQKRQCNRCNRVQDTYRIAATDNGRAPSVRG